MTVGLTHVLQEGPLVQHLVSLVAPSVWTNGSLIGWDLFFYISRNCWWVCILKKKLRPKGPTLVCTWVLGGPTETITLREGLAKLLPWQFTITFLKDISGQVHYNATLECYHGTTVLGNEMKSCITQLPAGRPCQARVRQTASTGRIRSAGRCLAKVNDVT